MGVKFGSLTVPRSWIEVVKNDVHSWQVRVSAPASAAGQAECQLSSSYCSTSFAFEFFDTNAPQVVATELP